MSSPTLKECIEAAHEAEKAYQATPAPWNITNATDEQINAYAVAEERYEFARERLQEALLEAMKGDRLGL